MTTPHAPESGEVVLGTRELDAAARDAAFGSPMIDIPFDRVLAQAWTVFRNLGSLLEERGVGFGHVVRLRLLLRDLRDLPVVTRVSEQFLVDAAPVVTAVQISSRGVDPDILLALDAVAAAATSGPPEPVEGEDPAGAGTGWARANRAGPLIFVGATVGRDPGSGRIPRHRGELATEVDELSGSALHDPRAEAALVQAWLAFDSIEKLLDSAGASLSDVVKLTGWLGFAMRDYKPLADVRAALTPRGLRPASGSVTIEALPEGAELAFEAIAIADERPPPGSQSAMSEIYVDARLGGGYAWASGEVPIDLDVPRLVSRPSELPPGRRDASTGRLDGPAVAEIQALDVYDRHSRHLASLGTSLADVVHQTLFLRDASDYPQVEAAARAAFGAELPATTVVPVVDISPMEGTRVEIELVATTAPGPRRAER